MSVPPARRHVVIAGDELNQGRFEEHAQEVGPTMKRLFVHEEDDLLFGRQRIHMPSQTISDASLPFFGSRDDFAEIFWGNNQNRDVVRRGTGGDFDYAHGSFERQDGANRLKQLLAEMQGPGQAGRYNGLTPSDASVANAYATLSRAYADHEGHDFAVRRILLVNPTGEKGSGKAFALIIGSMFKLEPEKSGQKRKLASVSHVVISPDPAGAGVATAFADYLQRLKFDVKAYAVGKPGPQNEFDAVAAHARMAGKLEELMRNHEQLQQQHEQAQAELTEAKGQLEAAERRAVTAGTERTTANNKAKALLTTMQEIKTAAAGSGALQHGKTVKTILAKADAALQTHGKP